MIQSKREMHDTPSDATDEQRSESGAEEIKGCCATLYQSDLVRHLVGDSFHPGGEALTIRLGELLQLAPDHLVLDVASGQGTSAILLAQRFGCRVLGIDYGRTATALANERAQALGLAHLVSFQQGDAEQLPVLDATFDAILCECAFCTFPDKERAAAEFQRVLKLGGRVGLSDLTRNGEVPPDLVGLLAWIACIADAQPLERYLHYLTTACFSIEHTEAHDEALTEMVRTIQGKLLSAELLIRLKQMDLPHTIDFEQAKALAKSAAMAIRGGRFGYALIVASKPASGELGETRRD